MASEIMDILPHKPFNALLSSFSTCPVHPSENIFVGHGSEAMERILTVNALKPVLF